MANTQITPVILTFNEALNITSTLEALEWADRVVVVDSGSTDNTRELCRAFHNVALFERAFDSHRGQWSYGIFSTGVESKFVLCLDADMKVSAALKRELEDLADGDLVDGAMVPIRLAVCGVPLVGSLCPPQLRFLRRTAASVEQRGHTQVFAVTGKVRNARGEVVHDDRKPLEAWVRAQLRYSELELDRAAKGSARGGLKDWVRRSVPLTPILVGAWAWIRAGAFLKGAAARRYALERLIYESLLRWRLETAQLERGEGAERAGNNPARSAP